MAFNYTEVLVHVHVDSSFEKNPLKILMARDHAQEINKPFVYKKLR